MQRYSDISRKVSQGHTYDVKVLPENPGIASTANVKVNFADEPKQIPFHYTNSSGACATECIDEGFIACPDPFMTGSKLITSCHDPIEFVERDGIQKPIPSECTGPHSSEISRYQACPREAFCGDEIISVDTLPLEITFPNNQLAAGAMCFYRFILMNQLHDTNEFDFLFSVSEEIEATLAKG